MRLPESFEDLTGKVCVCSIGRIAVVTGQKVLTFNNKSVNAWIGVGFDGKGVWASTNPAVTHESVEEYHDILVARFGGNPSGQG
jgi:hypothetical protein